MHRSNRSMLDGPLFTSIIAYTIPIILTSILQHLFNAADLVIVGRFHGSISVAAVSATSALINLIINLFIGLSIGVGVTVAHGLGSREDSVVHRTIHTAIPTALVSGIILTIVGIIFSEKLLILMGTPENVLPLSSLYMKIYFSGITFTMIYNYCAAILRAAGDTKSPLIFLLFSGAINVVFNFIFVTVFDMSVDGVAVATVISQGISAVLVITALMRRKDCCRLEFKNLRFYKQQLFKIIRLGLPAGIQGSLFSISNILIQSSVNTFGDIVLSGNGAAANIEGFIYVSFNAFHQSAVNFTGQNAGAHQYDRIKKIFVICFISALILTLALGVGSYLFGPQLLSFYITDSPQAIEYGMIRVSYVALPYFILACAEITNGILRGLGSSLTPMFISVLGICGLRILWIYTVFQIPAYHTLESLYMSYPISWTMTFIAQFIALVLIYKKRMKSYLAPA